MSYSKSRPQQQQQVKSYHCKVCESAKKPISMITSHFTKNREGVTVCPTLLSQECKHCGKKGHTIKYCSKKAKEDDKIWIQQQESQYSDNKKANKKSAKILLASFNVLYESDEEEAQAPVVVVRKKQEKLKETGVKVKLNWATAESDSEGDESE